jgi:hypothetical protein
MLIIDSTVFSGSTAASFDLLSIVVITSRLSMSGPLFREDQHSIHSINEGPRRGLEKAHMTGWPTAWNEGTEEEAVGSKRTRTRS